MKLPQTSRPVAARLSMAMSAALVFAACGGGEDPVVDAGAQLESTTSAESTTTESTTTESTTTAESITPETAAVTTETTTAQPTPAPTPGTAASPSQIPDVAVTDVSTGESVSLRSVADTSAPVALWFWFPH